MRISDPLVILTTVYITTIFAFASPILKNELSQSMNSGLMPCGTVPISNKYKQLLSETLMMDSSEEIEWPLTIKIYWHVIQLGSNGSPGNISYSQIQSTVNSLNQDYAQTNSFQFKLVNVSFTTNQKWFKQIGQGQIIEQQMKKALKKGRASDLNVYSTDFTTEMLGFSYFPFMYKDQPIKDGIVIHYNALAGGFFKEYSMGRTLSHEVGHWLGLFHTFENGCSEENDYVLDTRPQKQPSPSCHERITSCSESDFDDPRYFQAINESLPYDTLQNIMDYGSDLCLLLFTPGQIQRMRSMWSFRVGH